MDEEKLNFSSSLLSIRKNNTNDSRKEAGKKKGGHNSAKNYH